MIDSKGKLFGKINIIDLIIVLVLIALVALVATKVVGRSEAASTLSDVRFTFYSEEVPDYVVDVLEQGTSVMDSAEKTTMGTVESFEAGEPLGYETDTKGQIQSVTRPGYKSLTITAVGKATLTEHGAEIDGVLYGVGHTLTIYAGKAKLYIKISGIENAA